MDTGADDREKAMYRQMFVDMAGSDATGRVISMPRRLPEVNP